ncbi:MAG: hypothetical protein E6J91_32525 [Deltaproteobacteria bacterium]|nr:MAG: hypothetical protein E6J91_32525 [Deltaproteobacteria bacterium]
MNLKAFFVATLSSALDLGIASPDDVLRHVTPDVLAIHLPRPLWARLLTACVGAPRVDAQLVVETIGVPNLCEHIPAPIIWACIEELAARALGGVVIAPAVAPSSRPNAEATASVSRPIPLPTPPPPAELRATPPTPIAVGPSIPSPLSASEGDGDPSRSRVPPSQRFRQSATNSGIGRLATSSARRPQAQAAPAPPPPEPVAAAPLPRVKRGQTESDYDLETFVGGKDDWKNALAVEDEQLVDWSAADETVTHAEELRPKR